MYFPLWYCKQIPVDEATMRCVIVSTRIRRRTFFFMKQKESIRNEMKHSAQWMSVAGKRRQRERERREGVRERWGERWRESVSKEERKRIHEIVLRWIVRYSRIRCARGGHIICTRTNGRVHSSSTTMKNPSHRAAYNKNGNIGNQVEMLKWSLLNDERRGKNTHTHTEQKKKSMMMMCWCRREKRAYQNLNGHTRSLSGVCWARYVSVCLVWHTPSSRSNVDEVVFYIFHRVFVYSIRSRCEWYDHRTRKEREKDSHNF